METTFKVFSVARNVLSCRSGSANASFPSAAAVLQRAFDHCWKLAANLESCHAEIVSLNVINGERTALMAA